MQMISSRPLPLEQQIKIVIAHLRLPVQLTLAPLYLWGVFGAGGGWSSATVGAFVIVHLFLYGGTTVFNSYYDRDDGPIARSEVYDNFRAIMKWNKSTYFAAAVGYLADSLASG